MMTKDMTITMIRVMTEIENHNKSMKLFAE